MAEKDVLRLEVAVHDAAQVRRVQAGRDLLEHAHRAPGRKRRGSRRRCVERVVQIAPAQQLHHEVDVLAVLDEVVDFDDVLVADGVGGARFVEEAVDHAAVRAQVLLQDLDRDGAPELAVDRTVDGAHAALAEALEQAIAAEIGAGAVGGRQRAMIDRTGVDRRLEAVPAGTAAASQRRGVEHLLALPSAVRWLSADCATPGSCPMERAAPAIVAGREWPGPRGAGGAGVVPVVGNRGRRAPVGLASGSAARWRSVTTRAPAIPAHSGCAASHRR